MSASSSSSSMQLSSSKFCCDGVYCSISGNGHREVLLAYQKSLVKKDMCCRVGTVTSTNEVVFREQEEVLDHCVGEGPQVAINDERLVVIVFSAKSFSRTAVIKCTIGKYKEDRRPTNWERDFTICAGSTPAVAMSGDKLVLVFIKNNALFYKTGLLNYSTRVAEWEDEETLLDEDARQPRVALNDQWCSVVYKGQRGSRFKIVTGEVIQRQVGRSCEIKFGSVQDSNENSPEGNYPSITIFSDNTILTIYQRGEAAFRKLFASSGEIDSSKKAIVWQEGKVQNFVPGSFSSLTTVGKGKKQFVEAHTTNKLGGCKLWYEVGTVE